VANGITLKTIGSLAAVSAAVGGVTAVAAQQQTATIQPASLTAPDAAAIAALTETVNAGIAALPADASAEDIEAAILFAIDQSGQPASVVSAVLDGLVDSNGNATVVRAASNVRALRARLAGTGGEGTGSIATTSSGLSFGPSLGVGGGTSDYAAAS
jgi:hypothetical protein